MRAAHEINDLRYAHAILTTDDLLAQLPSESLDYQEAIRAREGVMVAKALVVAGV